MKWPPLNEKTIDCKRRKLNNLGSDLSKLIVLKSMSDAVVHFEC